ncbi:MAG: CAP domain-containing protein [bacterium]|nr:CAP domain-containing protein [bacterium]
MSRPTGCFGSCVALAAGLLAGCSSGGGGGGGRGELINLSACDEGLNTTALAAEAADLVNDQRANFGVATLVVDPTLAQVAQAFAEQMIAEGFATHVNPNTGEDAGDRMTAAGYAWAARGENLAFGQCSAQQAVEEWMASTAGHREILLNGAYTETGVGVAQGGEERMYWVQVFASPL